MRTAGWTIGLAVMVAALYSAHARSWSTPKPSNTLFNQIKVKNDSVIFSFIKITTESMSEFEIDGSDSSFILDFGRDIGDYSDEECPGLSSKQACWGWTKNGANVAALTVSIEDDLQMQTWTTKVHFVGRPGLAHSYRFSHRDEYLYGGPIDDIYPSNKDTKVNAPYITSEGGKKAINKANAVTERVWYTSGGRGIQVSEETPLFVSQDESSLVLTVKNDLPYPTDSSHIESQLTMVSTSNVKEAWMMLNAGKLKPNPPEVSVKKAMISTWVAFKSNITQEKVLDFVREIKGKDVDIGIIGIDDGWETCYGSQIFDLKKFPDPKAMIDEIHKLGHVVTFWVHPFVNADCEAHERLKDYLVKYDNGTVVTTTWWNPGPSGMIDFLNDTAAQFYVRRLQKLQADYGIDGFKFDAGEVSYIPGVNRGYKIEVPNQWTKRYVETASAFGDHSDLAGCCLQTVGSSKKEFLPGDLNADSNWGPLGEVRVGAGSAYANIRLRMEDTNSVWSLEEHGLQAVIPCTLQMTIAGYGATIPDMIGGNAYNQVVDKELYIRWTQLNAFLPVMQFSVLPWSYDDEVLELTKKYIALHEEFSPYMMDLYYGEDMTPVVAPLWWLDPYSDQALTCNDQFLVGEAILVAPVVQKGAVKRDVYFPPGVWTDLESGKTYEGPKTVKDYEAPLTKLPWFVKQRFASRN